MQKGDRRGAVRDPRPIFSGIVKVSMMLAEQAEIPMIIGGEASDLTQQGNEYLFRTSFGQQASMPKIANYIRDP
jgi:branched-chain amino acid transport system substrate-binding protein